jgi:hypothetical protein
MKVGDLVYIRFGTLFVSGKPTKDAELKEKTGVILDSLEDTDGFFSYEVLFDGMLEWFSDLDLRYFDEAR